MHTPGPWAAVGRGDGERFYIHHKSDAVDGGIFCEVEALHRTKEARATARANARLIAAAPETAAKLAEAVALLRSLRYNYDPTRCSMDRDVCNCDMCAIDRFLATAASPVATRE